MDTLTVGEVARLSGVTVRTLHHYDQIGLLVPSGRTGSGYRAYDDRDIERLQEILAHRELGLSLDEIAEALEGAVDRAETLTSARDRMTDQIRRLEAIVASLDAAIAAQQKGHTMTPEEKLSVFGDFDPAEYEAEAKERWGDTDAFAQSATRTAGYQKGDWETIRAESTGIYQKLGNLLAEGIDPADAQAAAVVEEHRAHISRWFYDCTPEIHAGLGQMYQGDARFAENIDKAGGEGVAAYLSAAIAAAYTSIP